MFLLPPLVEQYVSAFTPKHLLFPIPLTSFSHKSIIATVPFVTNLHVGKVVTLMKCASMIHSCKEIVENLWAVRRRLFWCLSLHLSTLHDLTPVWQMRSHIQAVRGKMNLIRDFLVRSRIEPLQMQTQDPRQLGEGVLLSRLRLDLARWALDGIDQFLWFGEVFQACFDAKLGVPCHLLGDRERDIHKRLRLRSFIPALAANQNRP
mmetsp:Transcript_23987/g.70766  ORF Transcript_23987/g.70766 Transcript_23987/m.70766 type:complete len:206 (+) Transcript_23987:527-1144(+)